MFKDVEGVFSIKNMLILYLIYIGRLYFVLNL